MPRRIVCHHVSGSLPLSTSRAAQPAIAPTTRRYTTVQKLNIDPPPVPWPVVHPSPNDHERTSVSACTHGSP